MRSKFLFSGAVISAGLMGFAPAFADFTPSQALERYVDTAEAFGATVSVETKEETGETVRWSGIVVTNNATGSKSNMDWLEASPVDADTVKILLGPKMRIETKDLGKKTPVTIFDMDLLNNQVIISEAGELLNASYSGEQLTLLTASTDADVPVDLNFVISDLIAAYSFEEEVYLDGSASSGAIEVNYGIDDADMAFSSTTSIASTEMSFSYDLPQNGDHTGFLEGTQNGTVTYSFNDLTSRTSFDDPGGMSGWIDSAVELSAGTIALKDGAFALLGEAQGITYAGQPPMPGFPEMSASLASATMNKNVTFGEPGEVAPMGLAMTLDELVFDEALWGMFDPTGAIPRDPATLRFDLGAEALWISNDLDGAIENNEPPFMPQSVDLRELFLTVGGASIAATGQGLLSAQTGQPSGTAEVELKGVLTLIQTLSEIGLIPLPQAMMVQGMLPQFMRPGPDGGDHMISDIEAMPDGSIFVNGTRVK